VNEEDDDERNHHRSLGLIGKIVILWLDQQSERDFMSARRLGGREATEIILGILRKAKAPLTTREIEEETQKLLVSCPDNTPVFLNRLRIQGVVEGRLSREKRGWIWWVKK